jgi:hypothetical protein
MDFVYYLVIVSILRNIFFGIIIDTFGKLRETEMEHMHQANNTCFVCGVAKIEFDKNSVPGANNFKRHREITHNKYSYLHFLMKIWYSEPESDNGIEMSIRRCVSIGDVSWFPIGMSGDTIIVEEGKGPGKTEAGAGGGRGKVTKVTALSDITAHKSSSDMEGSDMDSRLQGLYDKLTAVSTAAAANNQARPASSESSHPRSDSAVDFGRGDANEQGPAQAPAELMGALAEMTSTLRSMSVRLNDLERAGRHTQPTAVPSMPTPTMPVQARAMPLVPSAPSTPARQTNRNNGPTVDHL